MEIFQTIWTALTTENPFLVALFGIPFIFIEIAVNMLLFTTVLNISATKKQKIFYTILLSVWSIISNLIIPKEINIFLNMIILPILVMLIFKTSLLKAILSEILSYVIIVLLDSTCAKAFLVFFNLTREQATLIPIYREPVAICIYSIIYIFYRLAKRFNFNISLLDNISKTNKLILIANSIFGCIFIATQLYLIGYYNEKLPVSITLLSITTLLAYFLISFYSLSRTSQLQIATQDLEEAQLYNKSLKILHDNVRGFKHDFNNIVQAIGGYIVTNDMDGLKEYYNQLLSDCQRTNNLSTLSPEVINNPAIYSILTAKYHNADELGIKINLDVFLDLNTLNMKIYEFTRVLGILMDNAIEATTECKEKIINVELRKDFKAHRQLLIIENTYNEPDINIDRIFEKGYSSKPNNTGLGLWEVRQILKKNNNLNLFTTKDDKFFRQQLEIYTN